MSDETVFSQKLGAETRTFVIERDGVRFTSDGDRLGVPDGLDSTRFSVRFEQFLDEPVEFPIPSALPPTPMYVMGGLAGFSCFALAGSFEQGSAFMPFAVIAGLFMLATAIYWHFWRLPRCTVYQLSATDPALLVVKQQPSLEAVQAFIEQVMAARHDYLRSTYATDIHAADKITQLERLAALLESKAITRAEFDQLKKDVLAQGAGPTVAAEPSGNYL